MKIRKIMLVCLLTLFLSIGFAGSNSVVFAEEANNDPGHSQIYDILTQFPEEKIKEAKAKGYDVRFGKYDPSRYSLELYLEDKYFWEIDELVGHNFLHGVNNLIWQSLLVWDFTVIMIVENAFSLDVVDKFADAVEKAVQQMSGFTGSGYGNSGIIGNFLTFMIIVAGAWIAYKGIIQKKTTDALNGMLISVLTLILGLAFFANAGGVMRYLNEISSGLSQEVMGVGIVFQQELNQKDTDSYPSEISSMVVADNLYNMFIYEPYLMLQYGKTSNDPELTPNRINKILGNKVDSSARKQAVAEEQSGNERLGIEPNPMVTTKATFERLTLLLLLCGSHLFLGVLFLIIAGAMLVYQFLFVLIALFAPFAFLLSLNPAWSSIATTWFRKFVGYQLIKLIIGIFFSMLLTLSQFLYDMSPPESVGYVWTIAMQLILVAGVVWKRNELLEILQAPVAKDGKFAGKINIELPLSYVTKYTETLTSKVQKLRNK
ncbi:CD3337/EF1877 family mobilome membrane protein [Paenactinomyces guangxiensis]|uniref:Type IV secretion system protein n=1 Tax=Paenactinomyces guangxiensis TaxID=1490290 RepID=A0A7W2A802_9BACL|nr:type IV secretion system protein [Paenactinomyces guangxiensis]MBA4493654.1 type IV secretion system protein [Paenactinomyces guangxiensis]MBH8590941.1 type IV secretion system protein [Paenactinomyces guangxiensis]